MDYKAVISYTVFLLLAGVSTLVSLVIFNFTNRSSIAPLMHVRCQLFKINVCFGHVGCGEDDLGWK